MTSLLEPTPTPGTYILRFDNSAMENFITCARKSQIESVFQRKPAGFSPALYYGGVYHEAMEIRKEASLVPNPAWESEQVRLVLKRFEATPMPIDEWRTADNLVALLTAYNKTYPLAQEPFRIVPGTIELPFSVPIGHADIDAPVVLRPHDPPIHVNRLELYWTGRIDSIIEIDGSLMVQDHKTASVTGPTYYDDFNLSAQMHGYVWATRQLGYNTQGLYLDVAENRKPTKTGKAIGFMRQRYFYTDELLEEWQRDTFTSLTDFIEHMIRGYFPKGTKWCHGRYGTCPHWEVCTSRPDQRNDILFGETYEDDTWSPLAPRHEQVIA